MKNKKTLTAFLSLLFVTCTISLSIAQSLPSAPGFAPVNAIPDADAFSYVNSYKTKGGTVTGGVITRDALEAILRLSNCNAITYRLGTDPSGKIAPANEVFIILSGANVTDNNGQKVVNDIGGLKYTSNLWCPPSCMKFMIRDPNTGQLTPQE